MTKFFAKKMSLSVYFFEKYSLQGAKIQTK